MSEQKPDWMLELDERQCMEIGFARYYADDFHHGTDGHHRLMLIAKLADMLDDMEREKKNEDFNAVQ
jgi:hypothetical protein